MDVDLTRLRYFVAVAEELHFARAAERLRISPPPLSRQIRVLESEVGGALFERHYHRVRLTPLGEALLPAARSVLTAVGGFRAAVARGVTDAPPLRIGITAYAPSGFLLEFQEACRGLAAGADAVVAGSAAEVKEQLLSGGLDIGLIHLPVLDSRLLKQVISSYPTALAVRADDPLAQLAAIRVEDVRDRDILVDFARPNPQLLAWTIRRLNAVGLTRLVHSVTAKGGELELANYAYAHGTPVVLPYAPDSFVGRMFSPPEFALVPFDPDSYPPAKLALAWLPDGDERIPAAVAALTGRFAPVPV
ncbi:LysR family transcriptional regulator [Microbacterium sp. GXF7504]